MKAVWKILAGAAAVAALTVGAAAPAAAQYYPGGGGYGGGGGGIGDIITGTILNSILRGGNPGGANRYYGTNNYNLERAAVDQCARAAEQRVSGGNRSGGYNQQYGGYNQQYGGYNQAGAYRVVQIDRVNRTRNGNMRVYGLLSNTASQGNYGYGYNQGGYNQGGYNQGGYNQPYGGNNQQYGGYNQPYGGYQQQAQALSFNCKFERNGRISDLKIGRT